MAVDQNTLTDDQTAVYDRQLRVWGVEVQRKYVCHRFSPILLGCS